jgi:hypothetical protein
MQAAAESAAEVYYRCGRSVRGFFEQRSERSSGETVDPGSWAPDSLCANGLSSRAFALQTMLLPDAIEMIVAATSTHDP